jgi:hypothetical protein
VVAVPGVWGHWFSVIGLSFLKGQLAIKNQQRWLVVSMVTN